MRKIAARIVFFWLIGALAGWCFLDVAIRLYRIERHKELIRKIASDKSLGDRISFVPRISGFVTLKQAHLEPEEHKMLEAALVEAFGKPIAAWSTASFDQ